MNTPTTPAAARGDGTHLLRAVLDAQPAPGTCCFASINDASVVDQARQAGVGATISVSLGGKQGVSRANRCA